MDYNQFKSENLQDKTAYKPVALSDIKVLSDRTLEFQGVKLDMTKEAFGALIRILKLSSRFLKEFGTTYGDKGVKEMVELMKTAIMQRQNKSLVVMVINQATRSVVNFRDHSEVVMSRGGFFNLFEELLNNNPSMRIKNMASTHAGNIEISVLNPNWEFQIGGLSDEVFHTGMTLIYTPDQVIINPFNERLVCTNGMVVSTNGMSIVLRNSDANSVNGFFDKLRSIKDMSYFENEFKARAKVMMSTVASYGEMVFAHNAVRGHINYDDMFERSLLERFIPLEFVTAEYAKAGVDLVANKKRELYKQVRTNMTAWELLNALTDISSHPEKYGVKFKYDNSIFDMQKSAGEYAFKNPYDLEFTGVNDIFADMRNKA